MTEQYCVTCSGILDDTETTLSREFHGNCLKCAQRAQWQTMTPEQQAEYDRYRGR